VARPYSAFAFPSWPEGAISTVSALRAGAKNASPDPSSQASRTNSQIAGRPANSATARDACAPQRSTSAASMTRRRPSRSATAPANASNRTCGTTLAANTSPRALGLPPLSSTAQAIATVDIDVPSREVTYPV